MLVSDLVLFGSSTLHGVPAHFHCYYTPILFCSNAYGSIGFRVAIAYAHRCGSSLHAFHFDSPASLAVLAVAVVSFLLPPKSLSSVLSSKSSQKPRKPMSECPMKRNDQLLWRRTQVSQARRERNWWRYNDKGRC